MKNKFMIALIRRQTNTGKLINIVVLYLYLTLFA
jgi:hypothetical protein